MGVKEHTRKMYDHYGQEYQKTRKQKDKSRLFNEFLEVPCMVKAVGDVQDKRLLDVGCGAGVHLKKYLKKGARCFGVDQSKTMIELAKKNCPQVEFKVASIDKLPYKDSSFDIVTASLCIDYIDDLRKVFKEISRVLKKGGKFLYSNESPISSARERYEDEDFKIVGIGKFVDKKTGKLISLGSAWKEGVHEWDMLPGMKMKTYHKTFRTQLLALRDSGFELVDLIDCKPTEGFKKHDPRSYGIYSKFPLFSIYVSEKRCKTSSGKSRKIKR